MSIGSDASSLGPGSEPAELASLDPAGLAAAGGDGLPGGTKGRYCEMIKLANQRHNDRERFPALAQSKPETSGPPFGFQRPGRIADTPQPHGSKVGIALNHKHVAGGSQGPEPGLITRLQPKHKG